MRDALAFRCRDRSYMDDLPRQSNRGASRRRYLAQPIQEHLMHLWNCGLVQWQFRDCYCGEYRMQPRDALLF